GHGGQGHRRLARAPESDRGPVLPGRVQLSRDRRGARRDRVARVSAALRSHAFDSRHGRGAAHLAPPPRQRRTQQKRDALVSSGIWIAASGASAQMTALDVTANNLANATTPGFKADQAVFQEHLVQALVAGKAQRDMRYTSVAAVTSDLRSGPLQVTQRPLDAAIDGDGYFTVQTPRGERYTRAGGFQLGPAGTLVTALGYAVLDSGGSPIQLPLDGPAAEIGQDGAIRV